MCVASKFLVDGKSKMPHFPFKNQKEGEEKKKGGSVIATSLDQLEVAEPPP
jgi:hypothetical protein